MPQSDSLIFTPTPCILTRVYFAFQLISFRSSPAAFSSPFSSNNLGNTTNVTAQYRYQRMNAKHITVTGTMQKLLKFVWKPEGDAITSPISSQKPQLITFCKVSYNRNEQLTGAKINRFICDLCAVTYSWNDKWYIKKVYCDRLHCCKTAKTLWIWHLATLWVSLQKLAILHQLWPFFLSPCIIPKCKPPHLEHQPSKSCEPQCKNMKLALEQTVFGTTHTLRTTDTKKYNSVTQETKSLWTYVWNITSELRVCWPGTFFFK